MVSTRFGCREEPFRGVYDERFIYPAPNQAALFNQLLAAVAESGGLSLLTGGTGTGKTMLALRLAAELRGSPRRVAVFSVPMTSVARLAAACQELEGCGRESGLHDPVVACRRILAARSVSARPWVLIFDEAQALTDEVLGFLVEIAKARGDAGGDRPAVVLVGQPALEDRLSGLAARHGTAGAPAHYRLPPFAASHVGPLIRHRMQAAGCSRPEVFSPAAIDSIARYSAGVPRQVLTLSNLALFLADRAGDAEVSAETVSRAASGVLLGTGSETDLGGVLPGALRNSEATTSIGSRSPFPSPQPLSPLRRGASEPVVLEPLLTEEPVRGSEPGRTADVGTGTEPSSGVARGPGSSAAHPEKAQRWAGLAVRDPGTRIAGRQRSRLPAALPAGLAIAIAVAIEVGWPMFDQQVDPLAHRDLASVPTSGEPVAPVPAAHASDADTDSLTADLSADHSLPVTLMVTALPHHLPPSGALSRSSERVLTDLVSPTSAAGARDRVEEVDTPVGPFGDGGLREPAAAPIPTAEVAADIIAADARVASEAKTGPSEQSVLAEPEVRLLLSLAEAHLQADRLLAPRFDNALYAYRKVLMADPDNAKARRGLETIRAKLKRFAEEEAARGHAGSAHRQLQKLSWLDRLD